MKSNRHIVTVAFIVAGLSISVSCYDKEVEADRTHTLRSDSHLSNLDPKQLSFMPPATVQYKDKTYRLLGVDIDATASPGAAKLVFDRFMDKNENHYFRVWNRDDVPVDADGIPLIWLVCSGGNLMILNEMLIKSKAATLCKDHFNSCKMMIQTKHGLEGFDWERFLTDVDRTHETLSPVDYTLKPH